MFYSDSTKGFYSVEHHGENIPGDAVEITDELYSLLINQVGMRIVMGEDGLPMLAERLPPPPEALATNERAWRDSALASTDGIVARHRDEVEGGGKTTLTDKRYTALQAYRQLLRGWPEAKDFPAVDARPVAPNWLNS